MTLLVSFKTSVRGRSYGRGYRENDSYKAAQSMKLFFVTIDWSSFGRYRSILYFNKTINERKVT